ncbi:MAG TPA: hypothetical protein VHL59_07475 [Thermoanaerobaculia bacterium]|nr:hypothetical protein [Thermoanaerobaculia bacterium]
MKLIKSTVLALAIITAFAPLADVRAADVARRDMAVLDKADAWRELAFLLAPIKTREDLDRYMAELRQNPDARSPLNLLSPAARERFVNSLVFTERGLGGYYYGDLQSQLTASQIYRLLSLFGAQHTTPLVRGARIESRADQLIMLSDPVAAAPADYEHYECVSRATCGPRTNYICTSNC